MSFLDHHRITRTALATMISVGIVLGSVSGCGPGYRSSYNRAPVVVHHHVVEHYHYVHRR